MPSPTSPLSLLAEQLAQAESLKGFASSIRVGVKNLARQRSPRSIVFYPRGGPLSEGFDRSTTYLDVDLAVVFRLWGADLDEAWDLQARTIRAVKEVGLAGGPFSQGVTTNWDDEIDTAAQGQDVELVLNLRYSASDKPAKRTAKVEATSLTRIFPLLELLELDSTEAFVSSTYGYPPSGTLYIDDEKLSYSAVTSTSFVGLVRGLGSTTAAAHSVGAAVKVTPSP